MLWRRKLGRIGCLEDSSGGEDAEQDAAGHGGGSKEQQTYAAAEVVNPTAGEFVVELAESVEGILQRLRDAASSARAAHNHDDGLVYEAVWAKLSVFAGYLAAVKQGAGVENEYLMAVGAGDEGRDISSSEGGVGTCTKSTCAFLERGEDADEAINLAAADGDDECHFVLEPAATEAAGIPS